MSIISKIRIYLLTSAAAAIVGISIGVLLSVSTVAVFVEEKEEEEIPIMTVMYHSFSHDIRKCGKYVVPPNLFENDIKYLLSKGYTFVDTRDILDFCKNGTPLPEKPAMITIDDGHYSIYEYIFPIMKKYNVKVVISPIAIECDRYTKSMDLNPAYSNMCWDNIKEMYESNLADIQNHSYDMHKISSKVRGCARLMGESVNEYRTRLYSDLKKADDSIYAAIGVRPECMVYPFGLTSKEAREVIDNLGYSMSISCTEGVSKIRRNTESVHMLKRYNRPYGKSSEEFFKKVEKDM